VTGRIDRKMTNHDTLLAFDEQGQGLPVVLIHGFPLCRKMWRPQVAALAAVDCRVICPDLPGFGESPAAGDAPSMATYADAVIGLLDKLGVEKAVVGGMSMGGYVLLDLVRRYPERLIGAIFMVTRAAADDPAGREKRTTLSVEVKAGNALIVADTMAKVLFAASTTTDQPGLVRQVEEWMEETPVAGLIGGLLAMRDREDYLDRLADFDLPSLVIGAELDQAIPIEHSRQLAAGLPRGELQIIPGAGHMVNLERPEPFNQALLGFIAELR
jgi:pimeloyl-ACP methyl ester carboxylesterase